MESVEQLLALAEAALRRQRAGDAMQAARAALRLEPHCAHAFGLLALACAQTGEGAEARAHAARAAELAPRDARVRYFCYLTAGQLQDFPAARVQLTYFCELEPENTQARAMLQRLGGPAPGIPPLPPPPVAVQWYDAGGGALVDAGDLLEEGEEPPPGPDVLECPSCRKRTYRGWVCRHCGAALPRPGAAAPG
jgi:tetratricopeptide (TPR) repeat protein